MTAEGAADHEIETALASLLGPRFSVVASISRQLDSQLFPDELDYIRNAVPSRRAEFATARDCARRALARLGVAPSSLPPYADRSPRWPAGIVGSISHAGRFCAAAVTNAPECAGCGIDLEENNPLSDNLIPMICTSAERRWLSAQAVNERGRLLAVIFSIKEAVYKLQYPLTKSRLGFLDIEINIDLEQRLFSVIKLAHVDEVEDFVSKAAGRFTILRDIILSVAILDLQ